MGREDNRARLSGNWMGEFRTVRGDLLLEVEPSHDLLLRMADSDVPVMRLSGASERIGVTAASQDGRHLAAGGHEGVVYFWDLQNPNVLGKCVGHERGLRDLCFSPGGGSILSLSDDGTVRIWHTATRAELLRFGSGRERIFSMALSPDGTSLVFGVQCDEGYGLQIHRLGGHRDLLKDLDVSAFAAH
ncbi:MAG TPA: hypothetical protein VHD36_12110 [Pirellulales bacterium]|nr:hypothetical protein [Pirellulales bacterium]